MERWSVRLRIAAVELFIKIQSVTATRRGFQQQFQRHDAPCHNTVLLWVSKRRQERSVKDSKPQGRPLSATKPENVERERDAMLRSSHRSDRRQALAIRLKNVAFAEISTRICVTIHTISKFLRNLVNGTSPQDNISRQTHFSFRGHHLARPLA